MCGITGLYSLSDKRSKEDQATIGRAMEQAIAHRGPDVADIWQDENTSLTLCHRRLAIIDLSDDGRQPMASHSGRYVVTYNGEIYNYQDLRVELEALGAKFKSQSDTEVMLSAFEHWGVEAALQKLNGMFAVVLWDKKDRQLHFMRDRFGKKPLYIGWVGDDLVFSSELKSLHAHPDFKPEIDRDVLAQYMSYGYVQAPHCIFQNIWQMLPASLMSLDLERIEKHENLSAKMQTYWALKDVVAEGKANIITKPEGQIIDEFEGKLQHAVNQRMISDVPFGAFLSGGIDSSSVVALMQTNATGPTKTFSIGFDEAGYNEADHAKEIAKYLRTDHQEFYVSAQDAMDVIPSLPDIYDEPFADPSQIPTYLISKLARDEVTVVLTGDGGDEILAGYDRHVKIPHLWGNLNFLPYPLRKLICSAAAKMPDAVYQTLKPRSPLFPAQVKRALNLMKHKDADNIYEALVMHWSPDVVVKGISPKHPLIDKEFWPENLSFAEEMIFGDTLSYRSNDLMVKTDRASMAVALEARAPLMDCELCEYSWRLPHDMKVRGGEGKWLLRQVLERHVPKSLFNRPKMGFSVPIGTWLRGPLKAWGENLLSRERLEKQGLFNVDMITNAWRDFQMTNSQDVPKHLWTALMFQAWHERWVA